MKFKLFLDDKEREKLRTICNDLKEYIYDEDNDINKEKREKLEKIISIMEEVDSKAISLEEAKRRIKNV